MLGANVAPTSTQIAANFFATHKEVKSTLCANCTFLDASPYYSTITNQKLGESVVTYANYTPAKEAAVVKLKVDRKIYGAWHSYPGDPGEDKYYNDINKGIKSPSMKYAKGHYAAYILCAFTIEGGVVSCTYKINEGIENQGQNEGTEGMVEALTRALVGSTSSDAKKAHYKGPVYPKVNYWKGSWADPNNLRMLTADGISRVYSQVYWNVLKYGNEIHAYWFPNDISAAKNYASFEIPFAVLVKNLGFDPTLVLKAN